VQRTIAVKRKWRVCIGLTLVLLLLLGAAFLAPAVRWPVIGWVRGEAFYDGMPASYWRSQIKEYRECVFPMGSMIGEVPPRTLLNQLRESLGMEPTYLSQPAVMMAGDDAVPVLLALCNDEDRTVRYIAIQALERIDREAATKAGALREWP
jgi:hypothetical protein